MVHLLLPESSSKGRSLSFFLAMEDYAAQYLPNSFFLWQVEPTVIFGRNQDMESEVNVSFCQENNIRIFRRKSGGGCVYADMGNLMISLISTERDAQSAFNNFLHDLSQCLQGMGIDAVTTQHNDILVDGHKVSGNAFHQMPNAGVVHGTLLYDVDFDKLQQAITPSVSKLESKGIRSVRQRVANLRDLSIKYDFDTIKLNIIKYFCNSELTLSSEQISQIEFIEKGYLDINFIKYGRATEKDLSL